MKTIKRIRVKESIAFYNDKHPIEIKKTAGSVAEKIGVKGRTLSLWNKGNVPKQIQALSNIAEALDCKFDDLFEFHYRHGPDTVVLKRIAIQEFFDEWNKTKRKQTFKTLSKQINYSEMRLRKWNKGELPFPIINFFNFCKEVDSRHSKTLQF